MNYRRAFVDNGLVFITIVTNNRIPILINNINVLCDSYKKVSEIYRFDLISYSIQKDHLHCIIKPENINEYPKIIKSFKYSFTKSIKGVGLVNSTYNKIWQNRYWEHTIKDEEDFNLHLDYIHYNPVKHGLSQSVEDWKYSSFFEYVKQGFYEKNWGSLKTDIESIIDLNYE